MCVCVRNFLKKVSLPNKDSGKNIAYPMASAWFWSCKEWLGILVSRVQKSNLKKKSIVLWRYGKHIGELRFSMKFKLWPHLSYKCKAATKHSFIGFPCRVRHVEGSLANQESSTVIIPVKTNVLFSSTCMYVKILKNPKTFADAALEIGRSNV